MDHHLLAMNDDGVTVPSLLALTKVMRNIGNVSVFALDWNWSGGGQVRMINRFLRIYEGSLVDSTKVIICEGAPSDCVANGLLGYIPKK